VEDPVASFLTTPAGFAIFFATLWCSASFLMSAISGWFALSRRFRKQSEPYGETKTAGPFFYTVYTRYWSHYGSAIRLTAAPDALYLSVLFLFRVGHPPLRIPWNEIALSRIRRFWRWYVVMKLGDEEQVPMRISERMARNLGITERILGESTALGVENRTAPPLPPPPLQ
jgi:hypothetical protein